MATTVGRQNSFLWLQLINRPTRLTSKSAVGVGVGVGLASSAVTLAGMNAGRYSWNWLNNLFLLTIGLHILTPLVLASLTVIVIARYVHGEEHQLLCLTPLPDHKFVESYFRTALYQSRLLLAILAGSTPVLVLPFFSSAFFLLWFLIPFLVSAWGFVRLAVALSLNWTLQSSHLWRPLLFAPLILFVGGLFFLAMLFLLDFVSFGLLSYGAILIPFVIASNLLKDARHWVRPR